MSDYKTPAEFDHMLKLLYAYDDLDWREIDGARQAVLPLYGARPEFIRDDDLVRFGWYADWSLANEFESSWQSYPAVILRARDDRNGEGEA